MDNQTTRQEINAIVITLLEKAFAWSIRTRKEERKEYRREFKEYYRIWNIAHFAALRTNTNNHNGRGYRIATVTEKRWIIRVYIDTLQNLSEKAPTKADKKRTLDIVKYLKQIQIHDNGDLSIK